MRVTCRLDVASPFAEVMFGLGSGRKRPYPCSEDDEKGAAAAATVSADVTGAGGPLPKKAKTWYERLKDRWMPTGTPKTPLDRFFKARRGLWTPGSSNRMSNGGWQSPTPLDAARSPCDSRVSVARASDEPPLTVPLPESSIKFKETNQAVADKMPELFRDLANLTISETRDELTRDAEALVTRRRQERFSASSSVSRSWNSFSILSPPIIPLFIPKPRPLRPALPLEDLQEDEEDDKEADGRSDVLQPELRIIEEYIEERFAGVGYKATLMEKFDIPISRKDLETLEGLNWLNDEVINFFFQMIAARSRTLDNLPSVHVFNTFFYSKLTSSTSAFHMLRRWTRKVDIFSHDLILIPLHLGMHWTLCCVNCRTKAISYYDSMAGGRVNEKGEVHQQAILAYLRQEHQDKKGSPLSSDWRICPVGESQDVNRNQRIPQQENGSDCGVFTCRFAEYISRKAPFRFKQVSQDMSESVSWHEAVVGAWCEEAHTRADADARAHSRAQERQAG